MCAGLSEQCTIAKLVLQTTSWPVLNACVLCFLASFGCCLLLFTQLGLYKLAMCTSMHMSAGILSGLWSMLHSCPMAPVFRPHMVAWGVGTGIALLLMCISHVYYAIPFSTEEFYMHHLWAIGAVCPLIQNTVLRAILYLFRPTVHQFDVVEEDTAGEEQQ